MSLFLLWACGPEGEVGVSPKTEECQTEWEGFYTGTVDVDLATPVTEARFEELVEKWEAARPSCASGFGPWNERYQPMVVSPKAERIPAAQAAFQDSGDQDTFYAALKTPVEEQLAGELLLTLGPIEATPSEYQQAIAGFAEVFAELMVHLPEGGTSDGAEAMWELNEAEWQIADQLSQGLPACQGEGCFSRWGQGMNWPSVLQWGFHFDSEQDDFFMGFDPMWGSNLPGRDQALTWLQQLAPAAQGPEDSVGWLGIYFNPVGTWSSGPMGDADVWQANWEAELDRTRLMRPDLLEGDETYALWFMASRAMPPQARPLLEAEEPCVHSLDATQAQLDEMVAQGRLGASDVAGANPEVCEPQP